MEIIRSGTKFNVREAIKMDEMQIQSLIFEVLVEYGLIPEPEGIDSDLFNISSVYSGGFFGVIEKKNGIIVGTFGLYKMSDEVCEIRKMYLDKNFRGIGLGSFMVNYLINKARELGFVKLELETASPLIEAIQLYKKMGFSELTSPNQTPRCDKSFALKL